MISVNGRSIADEAVAREIQHHPAPSREEAERRAALALVVRELLVQRADDRDIAGSSEDERIAKLVEAEVRTPEPTAEEIERYYRRNGLRFTSPAVYRASHIFFAAPPEDEEARAEARGKAEAVLDELKADPTRFEALARLHSACSSREQGGSLGQVGKGDTNVELELALATMEPGIAPAPIASRHGFHILRLDQRAPARPLPLDQARPWIADHLRKSSKRRAIAQYLQLLAASAKIEGIALDAADSPLVQ